MDNKTCRFLPPIQAIPAGKLNVHNSDPILHNTHGFYGRRTAFNIALPNQGSDHRGRPVARRAGQDPECDAHGWMLGWVYALDNPYFADGRGRVVRDHRVPPGDYTLIANQAYTGQSEVDVTVVAGETAEVPVELTAP